jgi:outer membrane protein assembly factor BamB
MEWTLTGSNSGKDVVKPVPFVGPNAHVSNLTVVDNVAYALTTSACGRVAGLWTINLDGETKTPASWKSDSGEPTGMPAFGKDGLVYIAIGKSLAVIDPKTMRMRDWFTDTTADFVSTPVLITFKDKDLVAVTSRDGRIFLLDMASLGGANHRTPLHVTPPVAGRLITDIATWQAADGTRWLLAVSNNSVAALKIDDVSGTPSLQSRWISRELASPILPVVVNGVLFTASTGTRSTPGVLYALDGMTGKELWNSGKTLTNAVAPGALWTSVGQVHTATVDGTVYTFGFPLERY